MAQGFEEGALTDGKPSGVWKYYDAPNKLGLEVNYDSSKVIYIRPDTMRYAVWVDSAWQVRRLSQAPRLIGSRMAIAATLQKRLRYPVMALRDAQTGHVVVGCTVSESGSVGDPVVIQTPDPGLAEEVKKWVKELSMTFIPAVYRGKLVHTQVVFTVTFCIKGMGGNRRSSCHDNPPPRMAGSFIPIVVTAIGIERPR